MYSFDWEEQNGVFSAPVSGGRVIIVERRVRGYGVPVGGGWRYDARIEFAHGHCFSALPDWHTFEAAEGWCRAVLPDFYRAQKQDHEADPLENALTVCRQRLPASLPPVYHLRLQALANWVRGASPVTPLVDDPVTIVPYLGTWSKTGSHWIADTHHGQAEVWEALTQHAGDIIGTSVEPKYHAKVVHPSGAELHALERFSTWEDAEAWVRKTLESMHNSEKGGDHGITVSIAAKQKETIHDHRAHVAGSPRACQGPAGHPGRSVLGACGRHDPATSTA